MLAAISDPKESQIVTIELLLCLDYTQYSSLLIHWNCYYSDLTAQEDSLMDRQLSSLVDF
jgi:hypothetical protein